MTGTSTLTETDIERTGEGTVYDAVTGLPNVTPTPRGPSIPAIRGQSATPGNLNFIFYQGATSGIVLSVDDIPRIATYGNNAFHNLYDVDWVQVLRGPQHTLAGANAFSGAYVIDTNDPVMGYSVGALTEFTYNEYSGINYRNAGFANAALSSEAALRIVAEWEKGEIPVDIAGAPPAGVDVGKLDDYDNLSLRGKFLVEPDSVPGLSVLVSADYGNGLAQIFHNYVDIQPFSDRKRSPTDFRIMDTEGWSTGLRARYQLNEREEIASITSYVHDQYSSSPRDTSFFKYKDMVEERFAQDFTYIFRDVSNFTGVIGVGLTDAQRNYDAATVFPVPGSAVTGADIATQAAYADIAWNFAGAFDLLFGGRIEHYDDQRNLSSLVPPAPMFGIPNLIVRNFDYAVDEVYALPKIGLRYNFGPSESVAFTARKGYNPGGAYINLTAVGGPTPLPYEQYEAEEVWTYEAAYRTAMLSSRLHFGVTAFYNNYKDKQLALTTGAPGRQVIRIVNQPDAESYGAEFEGKYSVTRDFDMWGSLGLLHTKITEISPTTPIALQSVLGNDFGQDPSYSVSLGAAWRPVENLELYTRGTYVDDYFTDFVNVPLNVAGGYYLLDIGASYEFAFAKGRVFVNNVTDETAYSSLFMNSAPPNAILLDPRTFGASLEVKF